MAGREQCLAESQIQSKEVKYNQNSIKIATTLQKKLDSFKEVIEKRSFLARVGLGKGQAESIESNDKIKEIRDQGLPGINYDSIHLLFTTDPNIPQTDAARRLETLIESYHDGSIGQDKVKKKRELKKKIGLSRIEAKRRERRRRDIQRFQGLLEGNSSKYLARSANSIRFKVASMDGESSQMISPLINPKKYPPADSYPIPLGGYEMNPDLFFGYSCEKMTIQRGKKIMKQISLHPISLNLFVVMYWFIHCRFFQVSN